MPSQEALDLIARFAAEKGAAARRVEDDEIRARLIWPMVDEGARLLDEGVALRASDIDVVWLNGYAGRLGRVDRVSELRRFG
jgi:3-hydroxyacyl-CoA dehydrogenase